MTNTIDKPIDAAEEPPSLGDEEPSPAAQLDVDIQVDDRLPSGQSILEKLHRINANYSDFLAAGVRTAAEHRGCTRGTLSVLITDDDSIQVINRDHLDHDYSTDVISFGYECRGDWIEGELIVSLDTAIGQAAQHGVAASTELLLYVVHGTLHICGMRDQQPDERLEMRISERECLRRMNVADLDNLGDDWQSSDRGVVG